MKPMIGWRRLRNEYAEQISMTLARKAEARAAAGAITKRRQVRYALSTIKATWHRVAQNPSGAAGRYQRKWACHRIGINKSHRHQVNYRVKQHLTVLKRQLFV